MSTNDIVVNDSVTGLSSEKTLSQIMVDDSIKLDNLTDVVITPTPALNERLIHNGTAWVNRQFPSANLYFNNNTTSFGVTRYVYSRLPPALTPTVVGTLRQFTLNPATNYLTYTGTTAALFSIETSVAQGASTDNRMVWSVIILNPSVATTPVTTAPALPAGSIPQTLVKNLGRNNIETSSTSSNTSIVQLAPNDVIGFFQSNVTNNDSHFARDLRIVINFINYV